MENLIKKNSYPLFRFLFVPSLLAFVFLLSACATKPQPNNIDNVCVIFTQYPQWYWAAQETEKKWGVPVSVQMAIIHQESSFNGRAKPARTTLLGIIPWKRPTTAKGYTQALNGTWKDYKDSTGKGFFTHRGGFSDATDFIGWYADQANRRAGIAKNDAYNLYLAYHEGIGGYRRNTYANKSGVVNVARRVESRAATYRNQLQQCQSRLKKEPWYRFW